MRNLFLSVALIALPALGFWLIETGSAPPMAPGLGDLSAYAVIVGDTRALAAKGDLVAAEHRVTDLEDLWDQNAQALQAKDPAAWGVVDGANDAVFSALRAGTPDAAKVDATLAVLQEALKGQVAALGTVQFVKGIAVTDAGGHPLPCEAMAKTLTTALATKSTPEALALQAKALERCNADDDARSDAFAAEALALLQG